VKRPATRPAKRRIETPGDQAWFSIRVDLVEGRGEHCWPRPGRLIAAAPIHSFAQLATSIDRAFARWDISHVHQFELADGTKIGRPDPDFDEEIFDEERERLTHLQLGEQFVYVFDFGDYWAHLCTVAEQGVDPLEVLGLVPGAPMPYFGWGSIPDQYGRAWYEDDSTSPLPPDPQLTDLPPLQPGWGPGPHDL
jgi:hypothetical protein